MVGKGGLDVSDVHKEKHGPGGVCVCVWRSYPVRGVACQRKFLADQVPPQVHVVPRGGRKRFGVMDRQPAGQERPPGGRAVPVPEDVN